MEVIVARELSKSYPGTRGKRALLGRGGFGQLFQPAAPPEEALAPISLTVRSGEALGIIGANGAGKSTLLKLIAGVSAPTSGSLEVRGRVASLLELGAGFHPMLTGRENVYLNAGLLGMRHAQVDAAFDAIVEFAELAEHIDRTVDTYSSGMYIRLAFSVAIHTNPDIFLVDEVLAVGDESFQRKCRARILALKEAGKTIVFVSHDLGIVQTLCDHVLLLDHGTVISRGSMEDTIEYYLRQAGQADAIHHLRAGAIEALFNHGRLSLYYQERELTAPLGLKVQLLSMGNYHESTDAEWRLLRCTADHLEAEGTLPRLPVTIHLTCTAGPSGVAVQVAWENTRPLNLSYIAVQCALRTSYTRWHAGHDTDCFPAIGPADNRWNTVALQRGTGRACELTRDDDASPLCITVRDASDRCRFQIDNADYMRQARIVHVTDAIPSGDLPLPPRRQVLGTMHLDPTRKQADLARIHAERSAAQSLVAGALSARLQDGAVPLNVNGVPLSQFLHLHFQFRTGDLWTSSHALNWNDATRVGERISATGRSLRYPAAFTWSLWTEADQRLHVDVTVDPSQPLDLGEYNISLFLPEHFSRWETPGESGTFGALTESAAHWAHANQQYNEGNWVTAHSNEMPSVTLSIDTALGTLIPTALQADVDHPGHILQLVASPGSRSLFSLEKGPQRLFSGTISLVGNTPS